MRPLVLLLLYLLPTGTALAQNAIHRCVDANGNPVFTDQPCTALHATPVTSVAAPAVPAAVLSAPPAPVMLCAATMPALRQAVVEAFASRDPNRLAGLMLWGGYRRGAVVADIQALGRLMRRPLLGVQAVGGDDGGTPTDDALPAPAGSTAGTPSAASALMLSTAADAGVGAPQRTRLQVVSRAGCLWLLPPD